MGDTAPPSCLQLGQQERWVGRAHEPGQTLSPSSSFPRIHVGVMDAEGTSRALLPSTCFRLVAPRFTQVLFEPVDAFCIHNPQDNEFRGSSHIL